MLFFPLSFDVKVQVDRQYGMRGYIHGSLKMLIRAYLRRLQMIQHVKLAPLYGHREHLQKLSVKIGLDQDYLRLETAWHTLEVVEFMLL